MIKSKLNDKLSSQSEDEIQTTTTEYDDSDYQTYSDEESLQIEYSDIELPQVSISNEISLDEDSIETEDPPLFDF